MKRTRHALHSCIMARRSSSWLLGLFPSANMGCNPSMTIPPQISTPRLLGKPARIQRQHRLALSPTRRRCIHFTPEASPNLRPERNQIYTRSEPKFTPEANPRPPNIPGLKWGDNEIVSTKGERAQMLGSLNTTSCRMTLPSHFPMFARIRFQTFRSHTVTY